MDLAALIPTKQYRYYFECLSQEEAAVYNAMLSGLLHYSKEIADTPWPHGRQGKGGWNPQ